MQTTLGQKKLLAKLMPKENKFWKEYLRYFNQVIYLNDYANESKSNDSFQHQVLLNDRIDEPTCLAAVAVLIYMSNNNEEDKIFLEYVDKNGNKYPLSINISVDSFSKLKDNILININKIQKNSKFPFDLYVKNKNYTTVSFAKTSNKSLLTFEFDLKNKSLNVYGNKGLYFEESIVQISKRIQQIIQQSKQIDNIEKLNLLTHSDICKYKELNNTTNTNISIFKTLPELLDEKLERNTGSIYFDGKKYSVEELNRKSQKIAAFLENTSANKIGVFMQKSFNYLCAIIGILRSGKCYIPLDVDSPIDRNNTIIKQCNMDMVIYEDEKKISSLTIDGKISLDKAVKSTYKYEKVHIDSQSIAYIIFTSGSTGIPKGVCIKQESVINRIQWMSKQYKISRKDVILHKTPMTFDVSVWELLLWIFSDSQLVILPSKKESDPEFILNTVKNYKVTVMHFVPSMLNVFLEYLESANIALPSLKFVFCSGEALLPSHVKKFYKQFTKITRLVNLYGPTEATIDATFHNVNENENPVVIGKPIDNYRLYIINKKEELCPVGMIGELCIAGLGVAQGYVNNVEKTNKSFRYIPRIDKESNIYFTGDLARLRSDGSIEYHGRNDDQVKIRGIRTELGEIEKALNNISYVDQSVIVSKKLKDNIVHLYGFVVLNKEINNQDVKRDLKKYLPNHMIPDSIYKVSEIPLKSNGKVDKNKLLELTHNVNTGNKKLAKTEEEKILVNIWEKVLNVKGIGINDNFFSLGGNSINFVSVLAKAKKKGLNFTSQQLFKYPTIEQLLKHKGEVASLIKNNDIKPFSMIKDEDKEKVIKNENIEDAYPMSYLQSGLVYQSMTMTGQNNYHDIVSYTINGKLNIPVFKKAIKLLVESQPIFRTSYDLTNYSEYLQLVYKKIDRLPLNIYDLRGLSSKEEKDKAYDEWFWREQHRGFEWSKPGLVQFHIHLLDDDTYKYSISQHNSALDGWSMNLVHTFLFKTYFSLLKNKNITDKLANNNNNRNFIYLEKKAIESSDENKFWKQYLVNMPSGKLLRSREEKVHRGNEVIFEDIPLPEGLSDKIIDLANNLGIPVKDVLLASHIKFISLLTQNSDVFTGYEIGGRPELQDADKALGVFLNTMPFRINIENCKTWEELIKKVYKTEGEVLPHRRYPMAKIMQDNSKKGKLFESVFNFTHFYSLKELRKLEGFELIDVRAAAITEFPLRVEYSRHFYTDEIELSLHYHTSEYSLNDIKFFGNILISILEKMVNQSKESPKVLDETIKTLKKDYYFTVKKDKVKFDEEDINSSTSNKNLTLVKQVWSKVLEIPCSKIKDSDDFFDIGGNSLLLIKVSALLGNRVTLKQLMKNSTAKLLAKELDGETISKEKLDQHNLIQCLSKNTECTNNVLFIPYAGGNAVNFLKIAREFENNYSNVAIHAVEFPGHDPNLSNEKLLSFEEMVNRIVDEIKYKFKNKNLYIWGHCIGSALAIKITDRLLKNENICIKRLYIAGKLLTNKDDINNTIENARNLKFNDISDLYAQWNETSITSKYPKEFRNNLVKAFKNDSIELNKYLYKLSSCKESLIKQVPTKVVIAQDDTLTTNYQKEWKNWGKVVQPITLKTISQGGHYFNQSVPNEVYKIIQNDINID